MGRKLGQDVRDMTLQCIERGLTGGEIAVLFGITHPALLRRSSYWKMRIPRDQRGERNPNWRGGPPSQIVHDGYIKLYRPQHPHADCRGYVFEHRLVMEETLGRYLMAEEVVHHNDHTKQNNAVDNLTLFGSQRAHIAFHIRTDPVFQAKPDAEVDDLPF